MLSALRYYWVAAKGYRLHPWQSPYIRWRMETYFGSIGAELDARSFLRLVWVERARLRSFLRWAGDLRRRQNS